jgi:hypothetical protein
MLSQYLGTILVGILLLGIVTAIVVKMIRDKKKGKNPACSYGCPSCTHACHLK